MGVSNKNAQNNNKPKGNKKPLQVLHISKKDTKKIDNIDLTDPNKPKIKVFKP